MAGCLIGSWIAAAVSAAAVVSAFVRARRCGKRPRHERRRALRRPAAVRFRVGGADPVDLLRDAASRRAARPPTRRAARCRAVAAEAPQAPATIVLCRSGMAATHREAHRRRHRVRACCDPVGKGDRTSAEALLDFCTALAVAPRHRPGPVQRRRFKLAPHVNIVRPRKLLTAAIVRRTPARPVQRARWGPPPSRAKL